MPGPLSQHRSWGKVALVLHFLEAKSKLGVANYLASTGALGMEAGRKDAKCV